MSCKAATKPPSRYNIHASARPRQSKPTHTCSDKPVHAVRHLLRHHIWPALLVDARCQQGQEHTLCQC